MAFPHDGKKFQKGNPGGPGRPKPLPSLHDALANLLNEKKDERTALDAILLATFKEALKGNVRAAQLLLDRGYGLLSQDINQRTNHTGGIHITWDRPDQNNVQHTTDKGSNGEFQGVRRRIPDNSEPGRNSVWQDIHDQQPIDRPGINGSEHIDINNFSRIPPPEKGSDEGLEGTNGEVGPV